MAGPPPQLLQQPANARCADCDSRNPRWASINLGVFICECCAGVHRSLGTHISQVRSVKLDTWRPEWVEALTLIGNARAKAYFEHSVPEAERYRGSASLAGGDRLDVAEARLLEHWVRAKYEERRFAPPGVASPGDLLHSGQLRAAARPAGGQGGLQQPSGWPQPSAEAPWPSADPHGWAAAPCGGGKPHRSSKRDAHEGGGVVPGQSQWPDNWDAATPCSWASAPTAGWEAATAAPQPPPPRRTPAGRGREEAGLWVVDAAGLEQYRCTFEWMDTNRNGFLEPAEVCDVLETSGLPACELALIWGMSDVDEDGRLSPGEFVCAMHLTLRRSEGRPLPAVLPPELAALAPKPAAAAWRSQQMRWAPME